MQGFLLRGGKGKTGEFYLIRRAHGLAAERGYHDWRTGGRGPNAVRAVNDEQKNERGKCFGNFSVWIHMKK